MCHKLSQRKDSKMRRDSLRCESVTRLASRRAAALLLAGMLGLASPMLGAQSAKAAETVRLLTYVGSLGDWSPYVASELGYFKDEGIDFQMNTFQNPGDVTTAIVSGQGDVATGSL